MLIVAKPRKSILQAKCRELLLQRRHDQPLTEIGKQLGISHATLSEIAQDRGHVANAAYLESIYKYFTGKELEL